MDCYVYKDLTSEEKKRADQLESLYGFRFPAELFTFWRWHQNLTDENKRTFGDVLGMGLVGPFDVLAGCFDHFEPAFPVLLHWRFRFDPPEFVTIMSGDTDGLHWGFWFDDHERLEPVVAGYYARDAFEIYEYGDSIFNTVKNWIKSCQSGLQDNITDDPSSEEYYLNEIKRIVLLESSLPPLKKGPNRSNTLMTGEGMGIVRPLIPAALDGLVRGKKMWIEDPRKAGPILEKAYQHAERPILAKIVKTHTESPVLPSVSLLDYPKGCFLSLDQALIDPLTVIKLEIPENGLYQLPDLSPLKNLEVLNLSGNHLADLPHTLEACQSLREINLFRNKLEKIPKVLFKLPNLKSLILGPGVPKSEKEKLKEAIPELEVF